MISTGKGSKFQKDALILSLGSIISQAIPVLSMLVFSRFYGDTSIGTFNLFFQIVSVLSTVSNGRLEQAYFVMDSPKDARKIFFSALVINFLFSTGVCIIFILLNNLLKISTDKYSIISYGYLVPISTFLGGVILSSIFYLNLKGEFKLISGLRILQAAVANLIPMLFLLFYYRNATGLILGFLIGQVVILIAFFRLFIIKNQLTFNIPTKQEIYSVLSKFKALPTFNSPLILVDQLAAILPTIFIYSQFNDSIAGQFSLASRLLLLPAVVVGNALGQIFYKNLSDLRKSPIDAFFLFKSILKKLILFGLIFFTGTFLFSSLFFPIIFGKGWEMAGMVASYLSISMLIKFIVSPLSSTLLVFEKYKMLGAWQIGNFIFQIIVILFASTLKIEFYNYIWLLIIIDSISYLVYFCIIFKVVSALNVQIK